MRDHLVRWHETYAARGLVIIEVDGGRTEPLEEVRETVEKQFIGQHILWDEENRNHARYGVEGWPWGLLIGPDGKVVWEGNPGRVIERPEALRKLEEMIEAQLK